MPNNARISKIYGSEDKHLRWETLHPTSYASVGLVSPERVLNPLRLCSKSVHYINPILEMSVSLTRDYLSLGHKIVHFLQRKPQISQHIFWEDHF